MEAFSDGVGAIDRADAGPYIQAIVFMAVIIVVQSVIIWMLVACNCSSMIRSTCMFCMIPLLVAVGALYFHDVIRDQLGILPPITVEEIFKESFPMEEKEIRTEEEEEVERPPIPPPIDKGPMSYTEAVDVLKETASTWGDKARWWTITSLLPDPKETAKAWWNALAGEDEKEPTGEKVEEEEKNVYFPFFDSR